MTRCGNMSPIISIIKGKYRKIQRISKSLKGFHDNLPFCYNSFPVKVAKSGKTKSLCRFNESKHKALHR